MLHRPAHTVTLAGASAARLRLLGCSHGPAATAALRRRHCSSRVVAMAARDPEARQAHKQAVKEAKAAKRLQKQGLGDPMAGAKPCTLCDRPRNLLVRCQVDASGAWQMACGRCWLAASGGQVDGAASHPHYRYGGLWKNHKAGVSGKKKVPAAASTASGSGSPAAAASVGASSTGDASNQAVLQQLLADAADDDAEQACSPGATPVP